MSNDKQALVLTGPPGSGKSTLIQRLQTSTQIAAIETGRLLREQEERGTELGGRLHPYLEKGQLAPADLVDKVVDDEIRSIKKSLLVFDGYPRNHEEVKHLLEMENDGYFKLGAVLVLHLTRHTALKRISGRRKCTACGSTYNVHFKPPQHTGICDLCGASIEQRSDDLPQIVNKRFDIFENRSLPSIEFFQARRHEKTINLSSEIPLEELVDRSRKLLKETGFFDT
jgi:adenylate kinase